MRHFTPYLLGFMSLVVLALVGLPHYQKYKAKNDLKDAEAILQSAAQAISNSKQTHGRFPSSVSAVGYSLPATSKYTLYSSAYDVPLMYSEVLPERYKPYMNDSEFRLLLTKKETAKNRFYFCTIDETREFECVDIARSYR